MNESYKIFKETYSELTKVILKDVEDFYLEQAYNDYEVIMTEIFSKESKVSIKEALLSDKLLSRSMLYAELSKTTGDEHWYRVRSMLGDRVVRTFSDAGGLLLGNERFNVCIPNGYGDGVTRVAVFSRNEENDFNEKMMNSIPITLEGTFNVYAYDCNNSDENIIMTINGRYAAYYYETMIALVEY